MGQNKEAKVLEVFYEHPGREFTIRQISKKTNIPRASAHKLIKELKKKKLATNKNSAESNMLFKIKKINFFTEKIVSCGLIEELIKKFNPSCIILFGSVRKGDSLKESDIDLFVEAPIKKELNLKRFEKKIRHRIQLFVESDINKLHKNLFNNVINGIKLYGSFKIR